MYRHILAVFSCWWCGIYIHECCLHTRASTWKRVVKTCSVHVQAYPRCLLLLMMRYIHTWMLFTYMCIYIQKNTCSLQVQAYPRCLLLLMMCCIHTWMVFTCMCIYIKTCSTVYMYRHILAVFSCCMCVSGYVCCVCVRMCAWCMCVYTRVCAEILSVLRAPNCLCVCVGACARACMCVYDCVCARGYLERFTSTRDLTTINRSLLPHK